MQPVHPGLHHDTDHLPRFDQRQCPAGTRGQAPGGRPAHPRAVDPRRHRGGLLLPEVHKALGEGGELVEESLHEHQEVKEILAALEDMDPADATYDHKVAALIADVRHHVEEEEGEMFPKLRSALSAEQLHDIGQKLADGKAKAPTHPHPAAPASGPGAKVAGPAAGMVDRVRDKLTDRPANPSG